MDGVGEADAYTDGLEDGERTGVFAGDPRHERSSLSYEESKSD
jgi:hypothetical protein